jgi:haloalkane dehalogenase
MELLRTPDERFRDLPDFPFEPRYVELDGVRVHTVDEGPRGAAPVLLLHGEPSWSFLYRRMIPPLVRAGHRVVAPDLVGFGRSDKPARIEDHSYARHVAWMRAFVETLDLRDATLFCQDWGGLIGLCVVAAVPDRFARVVAANTGLPTGERAGTPFASALPFLAWRTFARWSPVFPIGRIVATGTRRGLAPAARAAYDAPFPSRAHTAGPRAMPRLVPIDARAPGAAQSRAAWEVLTGWDKPFLTAFSDGDPITRGAERAFQERIPGARGRSHVTIRRARHFLQEDAGDELAAVIDAFVKETA